MPSGRGPWTVQDDGGVPVGALVVSGVFVWMGVAVVAWVLRNEVLIYGAMGLTAAAAVSVFARVWRRERRVQTWKPVRDRQIETLPVTVSISPVAAPAAIEASKTIGGPFARP